MLVEFAWQSQDGTFYIGPVSDLPDKAKEEWSNALAEQRKPDDM